MTTARESEAQSLLEQYASMFERARGAGLPLLEETMDYTRVVQRIERVIWRVAGGQEVPSYEADVSELRRIAGMFRDARSKGK